MLEKKGMETGRLLIMPNASNTDTAIANAHNRAFYTKSRIFMVMYPVFQPKTTFLFYYANHKGMICDVRLQVASCDVW